MNKSFLTKVLSALLIVMLALGAFPITPAYAATSGPNLPDVGANVNGPGTVNWTNPGNVISNNNAYATVAVNNSTSEYLQATDFDFAIPAASTIAGIQVTIGRFGSTGGGQDIQDNVVQLIKGGSLVGSNLGDTANDWPGAEAAANYGATNNLWGTTWTPAEINDINFGVALAVDSTNARTASVDYIQVTVTYFLNATTVGVATATSGSSSSINVSMPYTDDGDADNTYTVEYCLTSANCPVSGSWTTFVSGAAHSASPFATSITGLVPATSYDVRVTYNDADGITGTNPQTITNVTTAACGGSLTYTIPAGSDRVVVVIVSSEGGGAIGTPNLSGFGAATLISNPVNGNARIYAGYRVVGTSAVAQATTITATNGTCFYANTYTGINQTAGTGASNTINSVATGTAAAGTTTTNTSVFNATGGAVVNQAGGRVIYAINMNNVGPSGTGTSGVWTFSELFDGSQTADGNRTAVGQSTTTTAGSATISVTDGGTAHNRSALVAFALNAANTNTAPTVQAAITDVLVNEDAANTVFSLYPNFQDTESADNLLTYTVDTNDNPGLFTSVNITDPTNFTLDYAPNANGVANITIRATDPGGLSVTDTFLVTVNAVNDEPSFTASNPAAVNEDAGAQSVAGWATVASFGAANESGQAVLAYNISGSTCGTLLSAGPAVSVAGTLTYTPAANANGTCTFNVAIQDNGGVANGGDDTSLTQNFTITVNAINDEPSFGVSSLIPTVNEDAGAVSVPGWIAFFNRGGGPDEAGQTVLNWIVSNNTCGGLLSAGPSVAGNTLSYTTAANANGTCTFDLQVQDNGGTANGGDDTSPALNYTITVNAVNDEPSFTASNPPAVYEDSAAQSIPGWATPSFGPANESGQAVAQYIVSNSTCATLLSAGPAVSNAGTLTYTPAANQNGTCTFDVQVQDNGGTANGGDDTSPTQNFTITVTAQTIITASIIADDKVYNGDNLATFTCSLSGVVFPDVVNCTGGAATFNDKNVAANKLVTATGLGLSGADAFKYQLVSTTATDTADITQRTLVVTATGIDKIYDGNTNATVTLGDDRVGGDVFTVNYTTATFASPNVGVNINISVSGISIGAGADAGNYTLNGVTTASTDADITIAGQTITVTTSAPTTAVNSSSFNVVATASSGLPVTISVSGVCTVADLDGSVTDGDATVTMTSGTGTCSVFYDQAGASNFTAAPQVQEDVTATDSPVFTSANNTSFDLGFAGTFNITATGNPSTMVISVSGTLPSGITLTDNGNGTASFSGTPAAGTAGVYNLILTANNGVNPNGTQNFTLTVRNGPVVGVINSSPDTGDGSVVENESVANTLGITQLTVEFNRDVYDVPASTADPDEVDNPANYILVRSATGVFNTLSCAGGVVAPDIINPVTSVTYSNGGGSGPFVATVTLSAPLTTDGYYRLFVCGTTSIVDAVNTGLILAGDGTTPGTDFIRNFQLVTPAAGGGGGGGGAGARDDAKLAVAALPATGFAPGRITKLPVQPDELAYSDLGEMWIEIPALGVKTSIVGVPQTAEGEWDVTWLANNVGWLNGTAFPTWEGNSVVTAHVTNADGVDGPFSNLKKLKYGDQIIIHLYGQKYTFEVRNSRLTRPFTTSFAFEDLEDTSYLTLITCQTYLPKSDTYMHRRVIRAVLVSVQDE